MIESAKIDVDGGYGDDGSKVKAFLILDGDFYQEIDKYKGPNEPPLILEIPAQVMRDLYESLREVIL